MSSHIKIDERAFNRGVNEVLRFKPIVRIVRQVVSGEKFVSTHKGNGTSKVAPNATRKSSERA